MKYVLVNPNWIFKGSIYFGCREAHLPLEFGYSKALLEAAGHSVNIIDAQLHDISLEDIAREVRFFQPDFTVVTTAPSYLFWRCAPPELTCPQAVIDAVKPSAGKIVLVGPHASTTPSAAQRKTGADIVISGECEEVLVQLAEKALEDIPSAGYLKNDIFVGATIRHSSNMAELPPLQWSHEDLILHRHHHHRFDIEAQGWGAEMETSRGCPYSCSFCAKENFRNKYRKRPLPVILEELDGLIKTGASYVYFVDEIFLPNKELLEALKEREIKFGVQTRIDLWDYEMLKLLGEAGCVSIEAGVESITEEGRKELNKNCKITTDEMTARLIYARNYVPFVQGNLIQAGTDDMEAVESWRLQLQEHNVWANKPVPLFPYPGSPDYTKLWGVADDMAWERAHEHYLKLYDKFSDVQEERPVDLSVLELPAPRAEQPLRVLMTCDTIGGVWTYALDLCRLLSRQNVVVKLAVLGPRMSQEQRAELQEIPHVQFCENDGKLEWMEDPWNDVRRTGEWLIDVAARFHPSVVHLNGYAHASLDWGCPVIVVAHSCIYSWWDAVLKSRPPAQFELYRQVVTAGLKAADVIVAPTRAVVHDLHRYYSVDHREYRVIYNGRDLPEIRTGSREHVVFSAGRVWDEAKNFSLLDDIAPNIDWPVLVAGAKTQNGTQVRLKNLQLLGQLSQSELQTYYSSASVFVSAALYEPFGLCALEAALSGCALVLGDLNSLREIWQDNAIFVDPHDSACLERAINTLVNDEVIRQTYAARAQKQARRFTAGKMAEEYLKLYRQLLNEPLLNVRTNVLGAPVHKVSQAGLLHNGIMSGTPPGSNVSVGRRL